MAVRVRRNCMVCRGGETMVAGRAALMMDAVGPGDHLDPYRIDSRVARSGMTCIFRGTDLRTGRDRASSFRGGVQPDFFDRFSSRGGDRHGIGSSGRGQGSGRRRRQSSLYGNRVGGGAAAAPSAR